VPQLPTFEGVPSLAELTELNTSFAHKLLEQQSTYARQLATIFTSVQQAAAQTTDRVVKSATTATTNAATTAATATAPTGSKN
jgi:hypothetical protein